MLTVLLVIFSFQICFCPNQFMRIDLSKLLLIWPSILRLNTNVFLKTFLSSQFFAYEEKCKHILLGTLVYRDILVLEVRNT